MLGGLFLASYGLGTGGAVGNLLFDLEQAGVFAYVLPFMMIFALIFAILDKVKLLGSNKGVNVILALTVSLMSLQFNFVSYFFSEIFPRMGVLLSLMIVAVILMGLFFNFEDDDGWPKKIFGGLIGLGFITIVVQSFDWFGGGYFFGWGGNLWYMLESNLYWLIPLIFVVGGFIWIVSGKGGESEEERLEKQLKKERAKKGK